MITDETPFPREACKIEDVRYIVFRFQVSTDKKVGGLRPSKRTLYSKSSDYIVACEFFWALMKTLK